MNFSSSLLLIDSLPFTKLPLDHWYSLIMVTVAILANYFTVHLATLFIILLFIHIVDALNLLTFRLQALHYKLKGSFIIHVCNVRYPINNTLKLSPFIMEIQQFYYKTQQTPLSQIYT